MTYFERLQKIKLDQLPKEAVPKPKKPLNKIGKKKKEMMALSGESDDVKMDDFYESMRKKMVGICQCGCAQKSQKKDDTFYRHCICHIFPKRTFKSIATHSLNWVERTFWGGHHTNFDEQGMDKWPQMADWDDIKEKFHQLVPFLTEKERATKFYSKLETLIYKN